MKKLLSFAILVALFSFSTSSTSAYFDKSKITTQCPSIPSSGFTSLSPSQNVSQVISSAPENTTFVFQPGVYNNATIVPRNGQKFYAKGTVELVGNRSGGTQMAFSGKASNVYICGFIIKNYNTPTQNGALNNEGGDRWTIENVDISGSTFGGANIGNNTIMRNSRIHHNDDIGIKASKSTNATYDNVEVDNNAFHPETNWGWEGGSTKFAYSKNLTVRNSHIHDNKGPGLWTDIDNSGTLYEYNLIENNTAMGIFHEISFDAIIRYNIIKNNGKKDTCGWLLRCAGIYISSSDTRDGKVIRIENNYLEGNRNGITGTPDSRRTVGDMLVQYNTLVNSGSSGVSKGGSNIDAEYSTIKYNHNRYQGTAGWEWKGVVSWANWRAAGMDANGTYSTTVTATPPPMNLPPSSPTPAPPTATPVPTTPTPRPTTPTPVPTTPTPKPAPTATPLPGPYQLNGSLTIPAGEFTTAQDVSAGNFFGGTTRNGADIKLINDEPAIGYYEQGDWMEYQVTTTTAGTYNIFAMTGSINADQKIAVSVNGQKVGEIAVPVISAWDAPLLESTPLLITLQSGVSTIRLEKLTTGFADVEHLRISSTSPSPIQCAEDINQDGEVDLSDYALLANNFLKSPITVIRADINKDGKVDLSDYTLLIRRFLQPC